MATLSDSAFSRAGQNSREKFQILKQLSQVLYRRSHSQDIIAPREKRKHSVQPLPPTVLEELLHLPLQDPQNCDDGLNQSDLREKSFLFSMQSRDDYYAAHVHFTQTSKNYVPPCGHYNVSYAQVDKSRPAPKLVEPSFVRKPEPLPTPPQPQPETPLLPKLQKRLIKMVPFSKQGKRKPIHTEGPHEKRFMSSNLMTTVSTKYRKSQSPDLKRTIPRSESLFATKNAAPEYEPRKEMLMRDLGRVHLFSKMPKRKPIFHKLETPEGYEVNFSSVMRTSPSVDFGKLPARKPTPSPLPCFMHATCSRLALDTQTQKAYQMNCTNDSFFSSPAHNRTFAGSSFSHDGPN